MNTTYFTIAPPKTLSPKDKTYLVETINTVYKQWEGFLLRDNVTRITQNELENIIDNQQLVCMYLEEQLKGCAQLSKIDDTTYLFGMLCVDPTLKGKGYGRDLLEFMEKTAKDQGAQKMRLELLEPKKQTHDHKKFLRDWYVRKGYIPLRKEEFPKKEILAVPATFTIFEKDL